MRQLRNLLIAAAAVWLSAAPAYAQWFAEAPVAAPEIKYDQDFVYTFAATGFSTTHQDVSFCSSPADCQASDSDVQSNDCVSKISLPRAGNAGPLNVSSFQRGFAAVRVTGASTGGTVTVGCSDTDKRYYSSEDSEWTSSTTVANAVDFHSACRDRSLRGGGYDSNSDTYEWACGNYPWTGERGAASNDFSSPTKAGGVAYDVTCTGTYAPDPLCLFTGEVIRVNAMSDINLALDMVRPGGSVFLPVFSNSDAGLYQIGRCGADSYGGTANPCPVLRPPHENVTPKTLQVVGGRTLVMEGNDPDGIRDGARTGVWLLNDNGHDDADAKDADGVRTPRRQGIIGGLTAVRLCMGTPAAGDLECDQQDTIYNKTVSLGSESSEILGTQSDPTALCVRNDLTNTGMCEDDLRIRCNSGTHCTNVGLSNSCLGFADTIGDLIDDRGGEPVAVIYERDNIDRAGANQTTNMSGQFWVASVSATACETDGVQVALTNTPGEVANTGPWPFFNEQVGTGVSDNNELWILDEDAVQTGLAYTGGTSAPAQTPMYRVQAADVPTCSSATSGLLVTITDDDGSCTDTVQGTLDGGEAFAIPGSINECYCDGADWIDADCEGATYGANRGCYDETSHFSRYNVRDSIVSDVTVAYPYYYAGGSTTEPIFDNGSGSTGFNTYERMTVRDGHGRITDMSNNRWRNGTIENMTLPGGTLFSLGFFSTGSDVGPMVFRNVQAQRLFSLGQGSFNNVHDIHVYNSIFEREMFVSEVSDGQVIQRIYGYGNYGPFLVFAPSNVQYSGALTVRDVFLRNHQHVRRNTSWGRMYGMIIAHDYRGNASYNAQVFTGPYIFDNVHFETVPETCFLYFDNTGTPVGMPRKTVIKNSSIAGTDPTDSDVRLVCAAANADAGEQTHDESDSMATIYSSGWMPIITSSSENGVLLDDYIDLPRAVANVGDCDDLPPGTVAYVYDGAASCADTDGVLDSGAVIQKCACQDTGDWAPLSNAREFHGQLKASNWDEANDDGDCLITEVAGPLICGAANSAYYTLKYNGTPFFKKADCMVQMDTIPGATQIASFNLYYDDMLGGAAAAGSVSSDTWETNGAADGDTFTINFNERAPLANGAVSIAIDMANATAVQFDIVCDLTWQE
jgi:hypothetical protein